MLGQRVGQGPRAPQKHSAVPIEVSSSEKFLSALEIGFFREPAHMARITASQRSSFDVAVSSLGASGLDSQHHNVLA